MPGTVQELASMFLSAIDSQGNVVNMGAVKEVVTTLERCPVSAGDLKDLKSTRLGRHINQVRRTITDKSLAKRMKRLVIQWRSLAQQSPSTPNGVPAQIIPPPSTAASPSPPSPRTGTPTLTPAPLTQISPPSHTPTRGATVQQTSSLAPPSRPPSSTNPDISRKRALQRLSTVKFPQSQPQKTSSTQLPVPRSTQPSLSPSPPIPSHPPITPALPPQAKPTALGDTTTGCSDESIVPSLHVRLPLPTVVKNLIVRVPLVQVKVAGVDSNKVAPLQPTPVGNSVSGGEMKPHVEMKPGVEMKPQAVDPCRAKVADMKDTQLSSHLLGASINDIAQTPPLTIGDNRKERTSDALTLTVSISRDSLNQLHRHSTCTHPDTSTGTSTGAIQTTATEHTSPPLDFDKHPLPCSKESPPPSPRSTANDGSCSDRGYVDSDGVWHKWTDPIFHVDSFAVNILPYVYVDGMDDIDTGDT